MNMICREFVPIKIKNRVGITCLTVKRLNKTNNFINAGFKCSVCDEIDEGQTGSMCEKNNCPYK